MRIPEDRLREFAELYEQDFGKRVTLDEASEMMSRVTDLLLLISRQLPEEDGRRVVKTGETILSE